MSRSVKVRVREQPRVNSEHAKTIAFGEDKENGVVTGERVEPPKDDKRPITGESQWSFTH